MILSMASDLQTRERVWVGRKTDTAPQTAVNGIPTAVETYWITGVMQAKQSKHLCPVSGWEHGSTLKNPDALYDLWQSRN